MGYDIVLPVRDTGGDGSAPDACHCSVDNATNIRFFQRRRIDFVFTVYSHDKEEMEVKEKSPMDHFYSARCSFGRQLHLGCLLHPAYALR